MATSAIDLRRWTRREYERMAAAGFFAPEERVELIDGIIYNKMPQSSFHATSVQLAQERLRALFATGHTIRVQMPLALGPDSQPEPDVAVVAGNPRDFSRCHPTTAVLVVEVADASLVHDRQRKAPLYARAGIPEYWLLILPQKSLDLYRAPTPTGYTVRQRLGRADQITPLDSDGPAIAVADLLP
jgi:Uma2 family endonuclease